MSSIRKAAHELNVSASAINRQIIQGEQHFGTQLFERLPTGLRLTAAGELLMVLGRDWEKGLSRLHGQIGDLVGLRRGVVKIAVIEALADGFVPAFVKRLGSQHPGIQVHVQVAENLSVQDSIVAGEVDFGIMLEPRFHKDISVRAHCQTSLGIVCVPDHPFAKMRSVPFSVCEGENFVLPILPLAVAEQVELLQKASNVAPRAVALSDNIFLLKAMALKGIGATILTSLDVSNELSNASLVFVPINDTRLKSMVLGLCVSSHRHLSVAANIALTDVEMHLGSIAHPSEVP